MVGKTIEKELGSRGFKAWNRAAADTIEPVKDDQLFLLEAVVDGFICEEESCS